METLLCLLVRFLDAATTATTKWVMAVLTFELFNCSRKRMKSYHLLAKIGNISDLCPIFGNKKHICFIFPSNSKCAEANSSQNPLGPTDLVAKAHKLESRGLVPWLFVVQTPCTWRRKRHGMTLEWMTGVVVTLLPPKKGTFQNLAQKHGHHGSHNLMPKRPPFCSPGFFLPKPWNDWNTGNIQVARAANQLCSKSPAFSPDGSQAGFPPFWLDRQSGKESSQNFLR